MDEPTVNVPWVLLRLPLRTSGNQRKWLRRHQLIDVDLTLLRLGWWWLLTHHIHDVGGRLTRVKDLEDLIHVERRMKVAILGQLHDLNARQPRGILRLTTVDLRLKRPGRLSRDVGVPPRLLQL